MKKQLEIALKKEMGYSINNNYCCYCIHSSERKDSECIDNSILFCTYNKIHYFQIMYNGSCKFFNKSTERKHTK